MELLLKEGHRVTIMTRGTVSHPFDNEVKHIIADRSKKEQLQHHFAGQTFDIVYDNICYTPNEAKDFCDVFNGKIGKLVFTSSLSTYPVDGNEKERQIFIHTTIQYN
ncbi:hypothetical protein AAHB53_02105 [Niallia circulans]